MLFQVFVLYFPKLKWKLIIIVYSDSFSLVVIVGDVKWWSPGYCSIPLFWIVNPIQIYHKYMIDNPNPNPIFKIDWQSNPNPITIQLFLEKDTGQQILNGQDLWCNHGIPMRHLLSTYNLTYKLIVWKFW